MVHHIAKRQKVDELETAEEAVLFNSDTLSKVISYLPSIDLLNLGLTCKRFGISDNDKLSVIKKSADILVQAVATEEQLSALPRYDGENALADYHYLQLMREPLSFDQLIGDIEYVNSGDKTCVRQSNTASWGTVFSNNVLRAGKHYASFKINSDSMITSLMMVGVMRPGQANHDASGSPRRKEFFQHFSQTHVERYNNNNVQCCMLGLGTQYCLSSGWEDSTPSPLGRQNNSVRWDGSERLSSGDELGMLLDLDEGTLTVYKNGRKLGVMKRGLAGPYCWVVSLQRGARVKMERRTIPPHQKM